jgi:uncharacterized damage-inducible protein DinB
MRELLVTPQLPGYEAEPGAALWRLQDTRNRTLRLLEDMPDEYVDRDVGGNSIGTILYHLALIEADWLFAEVLEEPYAEDIQAMLPVDDRDVEGVLSLVRHQSLAQHLTRLNAVRETLLERFRGMTVDDFHRPRELPHYSVSPAWVLHHLSQHEAEHRGEIGSIIAALNAMQAKS